MSYGSYARPRLLRISPRLSTSTFSWKTTTNSRSRTSIGCCGERFLLEKDCGYLAGLVVGHGDDRHSRISNGITSSAILEEIWQQYAEIPHAAGPRPCDNSHQLEFTRAFQIGGRRLCDLTDQFQIRFSNLGSVQSFGQPQLPLLMQPIPHELTSAPATILILLLYHERPVVGREREYDMQH